MQQLCRKIVHFASKDCLDIENCGDAVVGQLVEKGLVRSPADLYQLTVDDVSLLDHFAQKASENLIAGIASSKTQDLWRVIHGVGISQVGKQTAKDLAAHFGTMDNLLAASELDLAKIDGIGAKVAGEIRAYLSEAQNVALIGQLKAAGLNMKVMESASAYLPLKGRRFVITGVLSSLSRGQATELIEAAGGSVSGSISGKTNFLIVGEQPGSKLEKARKLGVEILSENDALKMLKSTPGISQGI